MGELTKKQEYIYYLFNSGMTVSEIARLTGTTPQNISSMLKRARNADKNKDPKSCRKGGLPRYKKNWDNPIINEKNIDLLSERERQIFTMLQNGEKSRDIAEKLNIEISTVYTTVYNAKRRISESQEEKQERQKKLKEYLKKYNEKNITVEPNIYKKNNGKYVVSVFISGKIIYISTFENLEAARKARDIAKKERGNGTFWEWFAEWKKNQRRV